MGANHPQVLQWPIWTTKHCYILNIASEDLFLIFPIIRKLMTDPQGMAKLDPKSMVGTIYAWDHKTLLYTKYVNYGPHRNDF